MKKYELTSEYKELYGIKLHRIKALIDFADVKAGDLGGWIEKGENLSQDGNAWVYDNAMVFGNAWVSGDAKVWGNAEVWGNARICCDARVSGNAEVFGNAMVFDDARVCGNARVYDYAWVYGNAEVYGNAKVFGNARVSGDARVYGNADVMWISKIGSRNDTITFSKSGDSKILVITGCFEGTIDEFEQKVKETHGENEHAKAYSLAIQLAKLRIKLTGET